MPRGVFVADIVAARHATSRIADGAPCFNGIAVESAKDFSIQPRAVQVFLRLKLRLVFREVPGRPRSVSPSSLFR